jgi:hypothetical protein
VIVGLWAGAACEWPVGEPGRGPVQPTTASPHIKEGEGECPTLIPSPCLPSNRHCRWLVLQRRRWLVLLPVKAGRREHHQCRSMSLRCSSVVPTFFSFGSVSRRPLVRWLAPLAAGRWTTVSGRRRGAPARLGSRCRVGSPGGGRRPPRGRMGSVRLRPPPRSLASKKRMAGRRRQRRTAGQHASRHGPGREAPVCRRRRSGEVGR